MSAEPTDQIAAYLLGELDPEAAAEFERELAADPTLRAEVEGLRPVVARLEGLPGELWDPPEPPPLVMPPDAVGAGAASERRRWSPAGLRMRPAMAAFSVLLLAIGIGIGMLLGSGDAGTPGGTQAELVLSRIDDGPAGAQGRVRVSGGGERATVDVSGLQPTDPDRFYELWLLDADGKMIALGSFRVGEDGGADVEIPIPVEPSRYRYFDVSLQEDNGDPTHSGVSVLRGPTIS